MGGGGDGGGKCALSITCYQNNRRYLREEQKSGVPEAHIFLGLI